MKKPKTLLRGTPKHVPHWRLVGRLGWESSYDENDNTVLEACAGEGPGGDSSGELHYRARQEVRNNMHVWVESSSHALRMDEEGPLRWHKKHEARRAMQRHHDSLLSANNSAQPRI